MMDEKLKQEIIELGNILSEHKDNKDFLLKTILTNSKNLINCDAGTIYLLSDDESALEYKAVQTDTLFLDLSTADDNIPWPSLALYDEEGNPNTINASVVCLQDDRVFNVADVHNHEDFNFEGPKAFDEFTGYTTVSMLVVPLKNSTDKIIGVLQLINKKGEGDTPALFSDFDQTLALAIASQLAKTIN